MDKSRIQARLLQFSLRPKNVRFDEIDTLIQNHVALYFHVKCHGKGSHRAYTVGNQTFTLVVRKPHIKAVYGALFLEKMEALDLFKPER